MTESLLLIDDDEELATMLAEYLASEGFACAVRHNGEQGVQEALARHYALVILDVMMPGMDGIKALAEIRAQSSVPILMLTARGDDDDRINGLELGADDYVPKPCTPRELLARIRAILRRTTTVNNNHTAHDEAQHDALYSGNLALWPQARRAEWCDTPLSLTSTEFNLLEILLRHAGQTVTREILSEQGLGKPLTRFDRSIDMHLSSIRRKIGTLPDGRSCIQTVIRKGYQLITE